MSSYFDSYNFAYLGLTAGVLYFSYKYISGAFSVVYNLYKYRQDKKYEAVKISRRLLAVPYKYQHHEYYALLPIKSHKSITVLNVYTEIYDLDENHIFSLMEREVTRDINKFLGHNGDFSGCNVTPHNLGFTKLKFKVMKDNGDVKTLEFAENQVISFDKDE